MVVPGFYFSRLEARGRKKATASIDFSKGLTVVSGASDTGKSYLVQCLDFMTGAGDAPEEIEEAAGYETLWLEIIAWRSAVFTLERSLRGGDLRMYPCGLKDVSVHESTVLKAKHKSSKKVQSVSEFLLNLCDLGDVELIAKKTDGAKWGLSFRPIAHLSIIDEVRIYTKQSPVHASGVVTQKTFEESVFRFLITGVDDSSVISVPVITDGQAIQRARGEVLREIIEATEHELGQLTDSPDEVSVQLERLGRTLEETMTVMALDREELRERQSERNKALQTVERQTARHEILRRLTDRFSLLERYYNSDLKRLGAMSEVGGYLTQLPRMKCPMCGTEDPWTTDTDLELLGLACTKEIERIEQLRQDLSSTMGDIQSEMTEVLRESKQAARYYESVSQQIAEHLLPAEELRRTDLSEILEARRRLERASALLSQLERLREQLVEFDESDDVSDAGVAKKGNENAPRTGETAGFCRFVEKVLAEWSFPDSGRVTFSERKQDLVINGKERSSHGKGIRALSYAAFAVALMRFCRQKKRPYPGFVVLDSPLVAYREPDSRKAVEAAGVKESFYRALAKQRKAQQVIVFENEDPPEDILDEIVCIHFSGDKKGKVRSGFFPGR